MATPTRSIKNKDVYEPSHLYFLWLFVCFLLSVESVIYLLLSCLLSLLIFLFVSTFMFFLPLWNFLRAFFLGSSFPSFYIPFSLFVCFFSSHHETHLVIDLCFQRRDNIHWCNLQVGRQMNPDWKNVLGQKNLRMFRI